jgi:hypothetical protein
MVLACSTARCVPSTTPPAPNKRWSVFVTTPSSEASSALARSIVATTFSTSSLLPRRSMTPRRLSRLACRLPPAPVTCSTFSSTLRSVATMRGISSWVSPRSTARSAPSGSGGSCRLPLKARMREAPTMPRSKVKMLEVRSHFASLRGTSISMRARPSSPSEMRCTRPIGKPENVRSMPMLTPSALSESSARRWVASNTPRA